MFRLFAAFHYRQSWHICKSKIHACEESGAVKILLGLQFSDMTVLQQWYFLFKATTAF